MGLYDSILGPSPPGPDQTDGDVLEDLGVDEPGLTQDEIDELLGGLEGEA